MTPLIRKLIGLQLLAYAIGLGLLITAYSIMPGRAALALLVISIFALFIVLTSGVTGLLILIKNLRDEEATLIQQFAEPSKASELFHEKQVAQLNLSEGLQLLKSLSANFARLHGSIPQNSVTEIHAVEQDLSTQLATQQRELDIATESALQANRMKSSLLAKTSHELLTPLNSILGFAECLQDTELDSLQQQEFAKRINENALHLSALVNDLTLFTANNASALTLTYREVNIHDLLQSVAVSFIADAEGNGLELITHFDAVRSIVLQTDPIRLRQIINNLVSNGIRHTSRGHIAISASVEKNTREDSLLICIEDTGCGIAEDKVKTIFQERITSNNEASNTAQLGLGLGLGLAIVSDITHQMGASIEVFSQQGKGTAFHLTIAMRESNSHIAPPLTTTSITSRALLVAGYPPATQVLANRLQSQQFDVDVVQIDHLTQYEFAELNHIVIDIAVDGSIYRNTTSIANDITLSTPIAWAEQILLFISSKPVSNNIPITVLLPSHCASSKTLTKHQNVRCLYKPVSADRLLEPFIDIDTPTTSLIQRNDLDEQQLEILVVDDNRGNATLLDHHLQKQGCATDVFYHGIDAITALDNKEYNLIILDIRMQPVDGIEVLQAAKKSAKNKSTPVIACTAHTSDKEFRHLMTSGFDQVIHKPVLKNDVTQLLAIATQNNKLPQSNEIFAQAIPTTENDFFSLEIAIDRAGGSTDVARKIFLLFIDEIQAAVSYFGAIEDTQNLAANEQLLEKVHQINGAAAMTGAVNLKKMADDVENLLKSSDALDRDLTIAKCQQLIDYIFRLNNWIQQQEIESLFNA